MEKIDSDKYFKLFFNHSLHLCNFMFTIHWFASLFSPFITVSFVSFFSSLYIFPIQVFLNFLFLYAYFGLYFLFLFGLSYHCLQLTFSKYIISSFISFGISSLQIAIYCWYLNLLLYSFFIISLHLFIWFFLLLSVIINSRFSFIRAFPHFWFYSLLAKRHLVLFWIFFYDASFIPANSVNLFN